MRIRRNLEKELKRDERKEKWEKEKGRKRERK